METLILVYNKIINVASDDTLHLNLEREAPDASRRETIESIKVLMGLLESIKQERLTLKKVMPVNQFGNFKDHDR